MMLPFAKRNGIILGAFLVVSSASNKKFIVSPCCVSTKFPPQVLFSTTNHHHYEVQSLANMLLSSMLFVLYAVFLLSHLYHYLVSYKQQSFISFCTLPSSTASDDVFLFLAAGNYAYIDVAINTHDRLLVDIDFRGQFQIARPTNQYAAALGLIPPVYVGRVDRLHQLVDLMTDATKRSLQKRSMHLPPWRRAEYMRAKWLSTHERVTDMLLLPCRAHNNLSREGSVKEGVSPAILASEKSTPSDSAEVRTLVSSKLKEIEGTGNPESPIFLDLDLDVEVDAVIYKGKVFPVGDRIKFPKDVHVEGSVSGGIDLYKLQAAERRVQKQGEQEKGTEKEGEIAGVACVKALKAVLQEKRVMNMDWQPPSVRPRTPTTSPRAPGLAAEMRKSGLSSQLKSYASMGMELRGELEVFGPVRRTFSADICS